MSAAAGMGAVARQEPPCTLHVIRDVDTWSALQAEWRELFDASPAASPPLRWEWLWEWWRLYGPIYGLGGQGLRILTVRRGARLIGALPLYVGCRGWSPLAARRLGFLSTGEHPFEETCPEYLDLLAREEEEQACLQALRGALTRPRELPWDEIDLSPVSGASALLSAWGDAQYGQGRVRVFDAGTCAIADLTGGFEAYLQRLSHHGRKRARQLLRAAEADGMALEVAADRSEATTFFTQLVQLHQRRWSAAGEPGCFASARFQEFHHTLCRLLVPTGGALLARLSAAGQPVAVLYGFVTRGKFDYYQSGVIRERTGRVASPGTAAHLLLMARLARQGITRYDFLAGMNSQKMSLATETQSLVRLRVVRPTLRTASSQASDLVARAVAGRRWMATPWRGQPL